MPDLCKGNGISENNYFSVYMVDKTILVHLST